MGYVRQTVPIDFENLLPALHLGFLMNKMEFLTDGIVWPHIWNLVYKPKYVKTGNKMVVGGSNWRI